MSRLSKSKLKKGYFKEVPLYPFETILDVYLCTDLDKVAEVFNKRYGKLNNDPNAWRKDFPDASADGFLNSVFPGSDGSVDYSRRLILILSSLDTRLVVHEAYHVLANMAKYKRIGLLNEGDEWSAYFLDYVTSAILEFKSYTEL